MALLPPPPPQAPTARSIHPSASDCESLQMEGEGVMCLKNKFDSFVKILVAQGFLVGNRWECVGHPITDADVAAFVWTLRLFYMKSECMSIDSVSSYLEHQVKNDQVKKFYKHMRESWESYLNRDAQLDLKGYNGPVKTNKNLINTLLYSGNFHSQEKYKNRYDELLEYMDESLIFMNTYNAMHGSYQMNQISRSLKSLREDNLIILLPNHLRHEWDENSPYMIVK